MDIEILEFQVPNENNKMLLVWDVEPSHTKAQVYEKLYNIFSCFGPLYLLKVCCNAPQNPPGFYALVKFYSAAQASKAQCHTDGQALFQTSPLKVRLGSRKTPHCHLTVKRRSLSHSHCVELANYFCGFNGWRTKIISLKELTDEHEAEGGVRFRRLKFGCELELSFPLHRQTINAAAVVEDSFTSTGEFGSAPSGIVELQRRCKLQRLVRERALVQAFSNVLLIRIGEEKLMVQVKDISGQLLPPVLTEEVVQVTEFSPDKHEDQDEDGLKLEFSFGQDKARDFIQDDFISQQTGNANNSAQ
ncbi:RAD52 motif-containing protein 1 [Takifugu flavidus]|uniref:RAD52 motif-containing protein 1 n=1 Tax=Takifugu flavidus TaxID=433684 RepID=A0A5C6MIJ0_9TELE|nr:RAD52 motif-containing protein 1 [Takifugu flavidus]XP_056879296.1 RAD52 motif-containing protein 1 [Takifugu flavidus]XP_056879297.1 RAD52 motif-containing protein 1 [Takifugu flavidus]XP_056879298.1 RAD52 motif-containing protein 1 [Takifugu flavidus]XP_056879299.1 RAD52 motif-containing protein 1 [Takifugu flavidus]XP_056879300.1 RAD52 motif-containing protein 1 [Takifugu flavidus]XP_056879301.1 RAD52 motif-containing protein 1 [Takifugu flavidus]TWW54461.1 RAD52 motif-containing prote